MSKEVEQKQVGRVWVVHTAPDGIPKTYDGEWAAVISVHLTEEGAEHHAQIERDSGTWGVFPNKDDEDHDEEGSGSSDRGFWIEVVCVSLFDSADNPVIKHPLTGDARPMSEI